MLLLGYYYISSHKSARQQHTHGYFIDHFVLLSSREKGCVVGHRLLLLCEGVDPRVTQARRWRWTEKNKGIKKVVVPRCATKTDWTDELGFDPWQFELFSDK